MNTFDAKFPGKCLSCSSPVEVGDEVMYQSGGGLVHVECTDTGQDEVRGRPQETCTDCWILKPCDCEAS